MGKFYYYKLKPVGDKKIKEFLFKVIHNIFVCNTQLYKWSIITKPNCIYYAFPTGSVYGFGQRACGRQLSQNPQAT